MAIFRKPVCGELNKKNRTMTRIDSQDDTDRDSLCVYKPKKKKESTVESLFETEKEETGLLTRLFHSIPKWAIFVGCGLVVWIIIMIVLII